MELLYVLPNAPDEEVEHVVSSALQMSWVLCPPIFCAASEMARDVAESCAAKLVRALPEHLLKEKTLSPPEDENF